MAATTFNEILAYVRPILGDDDDTNYLYRDSTIVQHLRLEVITRRDAAVQEDGNSQVFTSELEPTVQAILAFRVARSIVSGTPNHFSYKTPVTTVTRTGLAKQMLGHIDRTIARLENDGGFLAMYEDNEIFAVETFCERWQRDFCDAVNQVIE